MASRRRSPAATPHKPVHGNAQNVRNLGSSSESGVRPLTRLEERDVAPSEAGSMSKIVLREPRANASALESAGEVSHADYRGSRLPAGSQGQDETSVVTPAEAVTIHGEIDDVRAMSGLASRLRWIVRHYDPAKQSARKLSTAALGNPTHVGQLLTRWAKGSEKADWNTMDKIARTANVSLRWFLTGKGERTPYEAYITPKDPYPNRQIAVESAIKFGLPGEAIQRVFERDWGDPDDVPPLTWFRRIELAVLELRGSD